MNGFVYCILKQTFEQTTELVTKTFSFIIPWLIKNSIVIVTTRGYTHRIFLIGFAIEMYDSEQ